MLTPHVQGEGGGDDMDEEEVSDEEERELTIECGKRQGRWVTCQAWN
jgi:hypothetical protein